MTMDSASKGGGPEIDERYIVPGLMRGLDVLRTFTRDRQQQTIAEIARAVGITRSTAFRIVYTLEVAGFLSKLPDTKRFQLTSRVMELGYSYLASHDLSELAGPILRKLRDETQASTHLVVRDGREVVYIARFPGNTSLVSAINVGSRLPAHATAPGRVLLSGLPLSEVVRLYENFAFERFTESTPDSMGALVSLVEEDRRAGSVISIGFYEPDIATIATPVWNAEGRMEAALSISCPVTTYDEEAFRTQVRARVDAAADELSRALGYRPSA
jgi:DNA-binding IclR family transcriptional regulator